MKAIIKEVKEFATVAPLDTLLALLMEEIINYKSAEYDIEEYKNNLLLACYLVEMKILMEKGYIEKGEIEEGNLDEFFKKFNI